MLDEVFEIDGEEGRLVFHFTSIFNVKGTLYFVTLTTPQRAIYFNMEKREREWKISLAPKPPDWVFKYEKELGKVLARRR